MLGVSPESKAMLARQARFKRKHAKENKEINNGPFYSSAQWDSVSGREYRK